MYLLTKIAQKKVLVGILAAFAVSLVVASPSLGASDTFGIMAFGSKTQLGTKSLTDTIASVINVALSLLGIVAVVIVLIGGFKWMTAGGNEDKVGEARKLIFAGIIGLAIILSAYAIAYFVLDKLQEATSSGGDITTVN